MIPALRRDDSACRTRGQRAERHDQCDSPHGDHPLLFGHRAAAPGVIVRALAGGLVTNDRLRHRSCAGQGSDDPFSRGRSGSAGTLRLRFGPTVAAAAGFPLAVGGECHLGGQLAAAAKSCAVPGCRRVIRSGLPARANRSSRASGKLAHTSGVMVVLPPIGRAVRCFDRPATACWLIQRSRWAALAR